MYDNGSACLAQVNVCEAKAERQISPIEEAHRSLNKYLDIAHDRISVLEARLDGVLTPNIEKETPPAPGQPHASTMHGQLLNSANGAQAIERRIGRLLERLTL